MSEQNKILFDWLSVTSQIDSPDSLIELLGLTNVNWLVRSGKFGYKLGMYFGNISIMYDGRAEMGIFLNMSGQGCRDFETFGNCDWLRLFQHFIDNKTDYNITRLDVAYDDRDNSLDLSAVVRDTFEQNYSSRTNDWQVDIGNKGTTVYHGSPRSDVRIRIYDKKMERGRDDIDYWVRCEIQLRRSLAQNFIAEFVSDCQDTDISVAVRSIYFDVINNYIRYIIKDYSNITRCSTAPHWLNFLESVTSRSLFVSPGVDYNLLNLHRFVFHQAGNAIQTYINVCGVDEFMKHLSKVKKSKNPKYDMIMNMEGIKHDTAVGV